MQVLTQNKETHYRTIEILNNEAAGLKKRLSSAWQDLIKAAVMDQLLVRRNTPEHVLNNIVRPLRVLASCVGRREPWALTVDDASFAFEAAKRVQVSGKLGDLVFGVIKTVLDSNHLVEAGPLSPALTRNKHFTGKRAQFVKSTAELRSDLDARKHAEKLPERRAFWELVRIVFTENPRSFLDVLRFAQVRVLLLTGLRVGEVARLPADWKRFRDYYDPKGRPAGELGGYSRSLSLRHFGEKCRTAGEDSLALFETAQSIPPIFEDILTETLEKVVALTTPLRQTLKRQVETGRILPDFEKGDLVRAIELYTYLTGTAWILDLPRDLQDEFTTKYRADFSPEVLNEIRTMQLKDTGNFSPSQRKSLSGTLYIYLHRFHGAPFRDADGVLCPIKHRPFDSVYLRIGEVEEYLATSLKTKLSDSAPLKLSTGQLQPWELMFLMPKRAVSEGRNDGICDVTRYYSVGRIDSIMITQCISSEKQSTLFATYGQTEEDRRLTLNPHSLRHLQNTELFRLGVADTIITKRFNRRTVAQSYEYDHRSLAEELDQMPEPTNEIAKRLGSKTSTLARLIQAGKASGPIVEAFRRIQLAEGETAAFDFLRAEADGFHATPYGYCINNFTADPCPKHLECFTGCRHLTATDLPEHRRNLVQIQVQLKAAIQTIESRPSRSIGRANQLSHAQERLDGVQKLLATPVGAQAFPDGSDLSQISSQQRRSVLDVGK